MYTKLYPISKDIHDITDILKQAHFDIQFKTEMGQSEGEILSVVWQK